MTARTKLRPVAIYARVSSAGQDVDLSITAQVKAMEKYATQNGRAIVRRYIDEAESGRTSNRTQFQQMMTDALSPDHPFVEILLWKFSRFARNRKDAVEYK